MDRQALSEEEAGARGRSESKLQTALVLTRPWSPPRVPGTFPRQALAMGALGEAGHHLCPSWPFPCGHGPLRTCPRLVLDPPEDLDCSLCVSWVHPASARSLMPVRPLGTENVFGGRKQGFARNRERTGEEQ